MGQSITMGVAVVRPGDSSVAPVIARADAALYAAKNKASRDARGDAAELREGSREALVEAAFERSTVDDFDVYYQPIVDVRDGSIVAVEAILRWEHPDLGTIAPSEFLAIAERRGQTVTLGRWTIEKACAQTVRWGATRDGLPMRTCVNVVAAQLADPAFVDDVMSALARHGATAQQLALELPEDALASGHRRPAGGARRRTDRADPRPRGHAAAVAGGPRAGPGDDGEVRPLAGRGGAPRGSVVGACARPHSLLAACSCRASPRASRRARSCKRCATAACRTRRATSSRARRARPRSRSSSTASARSARCVAPPPLHARPRVRRRRAGDRARRPRGSLDPPRPSARRRLSVGASASGGSTQYFAPPPPAGVLPPCTTMSGSSAMRPPWASTHVSTIGRYSSGTSWQRMAIMPSGRLVMLLNGMSSRHSRMRSVIEPTRGLEPRTPSLRVKCSTS